MAWLEAGEGRQAGVQSKQGQGREPSMFPCTSYNQCVLPEALSNLSSTFIAVTRAGTLWEASKAHCHGWEEVALDAAPIILLLSVFLLNFNLIIRHPPPIPFRRNVKSSEWG